MNPFQSDEFLKLKKQWYEKLEDSGFLDIEDQKENLKDVDYRTKKRAFIEQAQRIKLYNDASYFLHEYYFDTFIDYKIWEMFSQGASINDIAKEFSFTKSGMQYKLLKLKKIFKFWLWLKEQTEE